MSQKIICPSCAGEYDDTAAKCPYCETTHIPGAEAEYMGKLQDVKEDMADLGTISKEAYKKEMKQVAKKSVKQILIMVIILFVLSGVIFWSVWGREELNEKKAMNWFLENKAKLDALYDKGDFDTLLKDYEASNPEDDGYYLWKHWDVLALYSDIQWANEILQLEESGELSEKDEAELFYFESQCQGGRYEELDAEEKERITPFTKRLLQDYEERFSFTEKGKQRIDEMLRKNYGYPSLMEIREVLQELEQERIDKG